MRGLPTSGIMSPSTTIISQETTDQWDTVGSWASSLCALHCLLSPLVFLAMPAFAKFWAHPASHALMAMLVVPLAMTVVIQGYRKHHRKWVLFAATTGIVCILTGSALPYTGGSSTSANIVAAAEASDAKGACLECCPAVVIDEEGSSQLHLPPAGMATIIGSGFLIVAHLGNRRRCVKCTDKPPSS